MENMLALRKVQTNIEEKPDAISLGQSSVPPAIQFDNVCVPRLEASAHLHVYPTIFASKSLRSSICICRFAAGHAELSSTVAA